MPDKKVLIAILLLLAVVRLMLVPLLDYQDNLVGQLEADTGRLERYYSVLDKAEQLDDKLVLSQENYQTFARAFKSEKSHTAVSVLLQNEWFPLLKRNNVALEFFNWQGQTLVAEPNVYSATIMLKLNGAFIDILRLQHEMTNANRTLRFTLVDYQWRANVGVVANVRVELLYQVQAA